jgi:transposase
LVAAPAQRPQGGGAQRVDEEATFAAVVFVLSTGVAWRALPRVFGVSWQNSHRRFVEWSGRDLWARLEAAISDPADAAAGWWAATLREQARGRLRESVGAGAGVAPPKQVPAGHRKPVVKRVHAALAERLFGPRTSQ